MGGAYGIEARHAPQGFVVRSITSRRDACSSYLLEELAMSRFKFPILLSLALAALAWPTSASNVRRRRRAWQWRLKQRGGGVAVAAEVSPKRRNRRSGCITRSGGYGNGPVGTDLGGNGRGGYGNGLAGNAAGDYGYGGYGWLWTCRLWSRRLRLWTGGYGSLARLRVRRLRPEIRVRLRAPRCTAIRTCRRLPALGSAPIIASDDNRQASTFAVPDGATVWVDGDRTQQTGPRTLSRVRRPVKVARPSDIRSRHGGWRTAGPSNRQRGQVRANETTNVEFVEILDRTRSNAKQLHIRNLVDFRDDGVGYRGNSVANAVLLVHCDETPRYKRKSGVETPQSKKNKQALPDSRSNGGTYSLSPRCIGRLSCDTLLLADLFSRNADERMVRNATYCAFYATRDSLLLAFQFSNSPVPRQIRPPMRFAQA